jgi:predicted MFS family arabinose efflux permease
LLSLPGRGMVGPLVNRLGLVNALRLTYVFMGVGTTALLFAGPLSAVWVFAIVTGVAFGSVAPLQGLYAAELFGHRRIGKMMGMQQVVMSLAAAVGPFLLGLAEDQTGSYTFPIIIAVSLNVVALLVFRPPSRRTKQLAGSVA